MNTAWIDPEWIISKGAKRASPKFGELCGVELPAADQKVLMLRFSQSGYVAFDSYIVGQVSYDKRGLLFTE